MSASLRIDKNKTKFAPVSKPRVSRRPTSQTAPIPKLEEGRKEEEAQHAQVSKIASSSASKVKAGTSNRTLESSVDPELLNGPSSHHPPASSSSTLIQPPSNKALRERRKEMAPAVIGSSSATTPLTPSSSVPSQAAKYRIGKRTSDQVAVEISPPSLEAPPIAIPSSGQGKKRARRGRTPLVGEGEEKDLAPLDWTKWSVRDFCRDIGRGKPTKAALKKVKKEERRKKRLEAGKGIKDGNEDEFDSEEEEEEKKEEKREEKKDSVTRERGKKEDTSQTDVTSGTTPSTGQEIDTPTVDPIPSFGPRIRINAAGERVIDESSLSISHASIAPGGNTGTLDVVMESAANQHTNYSSFTNKEKRGRQWKEKDTQLFWQGLALYGTDFEMIRERCFDNKVTRGHLKGKFKREDKINPDMITQALIHRRVWVEGKGGSEKAGEFVRVSEPTEDDSIKKAVSPDDFGTTSQPSSASPSGIEQDLTSELPTQITQVEEEDEDEEGATQVMFATQEEDLQRLDVGTQEKVYNLPELEE